MSKIHFEKLTPIKDADLRIYSDALDFVFENNDIKNIAITGAYSAGKSSVIESYKKKHGKLEFLHISIANFETAEQENSKIESNGKDKDDTGTDKMDNNISFIKESALEGKVLNQLLHQIDVSKIPQTNFRVKQKISDKNILKTTVIAMIFLICFLHICFYSQWCDLVKILSQTQCLKFLQFTTTSVSLLLSGIIGTAIIGILLYSLIKIQKNKSLFKRFSVHGNEIEIFEKNDESYFDKYLNEVLYLFDKAGADVIVFEDMDRYNLNQIFQRLREVNTLINSKRTKENKRPLRFFYLLRDDIFMSKDRTKFFDFIMPVVPVIDSSNSYEQFISHFKEGGVFEKFDEHFLQGISLYVDDMRILKNIYNEFMVYYNRIGTTEQDYNKLLAMVVYKNIFPRDFSDTQINIGFISTLFNNQEEIIEDNANKIDMQIQEVKGKIDLCNKEHLRNIDEVGLIYWRNNNYGGRVPDVNNPQYIKRKEIVDIIKNNQIDNLKIEISELELAKAKLENKKINKLITRENVDEVFDICYKNFLGKENNFKEIKSSQYFDLIKYLVWNGYIDETYQDYMTYFYPTSFTTNDKMFLRSVTDKKSKEWSYKIDNAKLVLLRLREVDFDEIETLNFALFDYLLKTESSNKKYLIRLIEQLKKDKQFIFMKEYFNVAEDLIIFVKVINHYWQSFLAEIFHRSEFVYEQKKKFILLSLYYCDSEDVDIVNEDNFLSKVISSDNKFLDIESPKVEKLIDEFLRLNVKFKSLNFEKSHKDLFNAVYQNKLFEFTFENIVLMLNKIYNVQSEDDIKHKNYSLITESSTYKLSEYVNDNINQYMSLVLENCERIINDRPEAVKELINNEDIAISKKKEYVEYLQTDLELLEDVQEKSLWNLLLQKQLVKYSEINILQYYFKSDNGLSEVLVNFINSNTSILEFSINSINESFGEEAASSLFNDVVICQTLVDDKYRNIVAKLRYRYSKFNIEKISEQKVKILIEVGTIKMTAENVKFMRTAYNSQFIYFVEHNIENYLENVVDTEQVNYNELLDLLSTGIYDEFKVNLICHTNKTIPIVSAAYSDDVKKHILQNNFDESELSLLISNYKNLSNIIKDELKRLCVIHINSIINEKIELPFELFKFLLTEKDISTEYKFIILTAKIDKLSKVECEKCIKIIGSKEHEKLFGTGRPKLEATEINRELLIKFKSKYWISDFREEDGMFKISRKKVQNSLDSVLL